MASLKSCCELAEFTSPVRPLSDDVKRKIGKTLLATFNDTTPTSHLKSLIQDHGIASLGLRDVNLQHPGQAKLMLRNYQVYARESGHVAPLLVGIRRDGDVSPIARIGASRFPSQLATAACNSLARTQEVGEAFAKELKSVGINCYQAPNVDPVRDCIEPLASISRFGDDTINVINQALAYMEGLHRGGVQTTAAEILPVTLRKAYDQMVEHGEIDADLLDETEISDLRPIFDGRAVDAVSLSSKQYALADVACANEAVEDVIELLRDHFHFEGPVCGILPPTPQAMQDRCPIHEPLRNLRNGHDIAMMFPAPEVQLASIHAVHAAYEAGVLDADSSARSAERVERLRAQSLAWTDVLTEAPTLETHVEHHLDIVRSTYRDSITTLQETPSPLADFPQGASVLLFTPFCPPFADRESSVFEHLAQGTLPADWDLPNVAYNPLNPNLPPDFFRTITGARGIILVLASTTTLMRNQQQLLLGHLEQALRAEEARRGNSPTRTIARVVVGAADVRDLTRSGLLQIGWWGIASWGWSQAALEEAAKVLLGERRAIGRSPITRP